MPPTSTPRSISTRLYEPDRNQDPSDQLLDQAGDVTHGRALVIATCGLDLICALLRRGCPAATVLRQASKTDESDYDLVLAAPDLARISPEALVQQIRAALASSGRIVACLPTGPAATSFIRRLRLNGFSVARPIHLPHRILVQANLRKSPHDIS